MLGNRLRRWPNIKPALFQRLVFAEVKASLRPDLGGGVENLNLTGARISFTTFLAVNTAVNTNDCFFIELLCSIAI